MSKWFDQEINLSSLKQEEPGLYELLTTRILNVSKSSFIFHIGVIGAIITGIIISIFAVVPGITASLAGTGWIISWIHPILGIVMIVGLFGVISRYYSNNYFQMSYGKLFYFFLASLGILSVTGVLSTLTVFGAMSPSYSVIPIIHGGVAYAWLIVSGIAVKGSVRHAVASFYRSLGSKPKEKISFTDACSMCGKCAEVCPDFNAVEEDEEAPVYKVRRYLEKVSKGKMSVKDLKNQVEDVYVCSLCGLCAGVCPYSYNHVDLYFDVLEQGNELAKPGQEENISKPEVKAAGEV